MSGTGGKRFLTQERGRFHLVDEILLSPARDNPNVVGQMNEAFKLLAQRYLRDIENEADGNRIVRYGLVLVRERDGQ